MLAYRQYGFEANQANTNLGTLKALAAKYPEKDKARILTDLVEANPGSECKWFAAAKSAGLFDVTLKLACEACLGAGKAIELRPEDVRDRALALCDRTSGTDRFLRAEIRLPAGSD